jgi:hypothetical protein
MGRTRINDTLAALQQAGIRAQRGFPVGKMPYLTTPLVGVCIQHMDAANTTLALQIYTPLRQGGAACEDVALQVATVIQSMDAAYQIDRCSFDSKAGLFHITVLAIFQQKYLE